MPLPPPDYLERVYAGVLGKLIGVYMGRPFEGWTYERIVAELGDVTGYVHERFAQPLIVTDDDISGTFTFLRSLPDHANRRDLSPREIGETWLNYIIAQRTILWWGGMGDSTEHTAFLRLKAGVSAPESGSITLNGQVVAEQIGAQIFIDGWGMVAPGDPAFAADLARRAASVSHDGEAIYGAQVIAAMEAQAFVESDPQRLLETALRLIPADALIARMIHDIRAWHAAEPDWRVTRARIATHYGYDRYGGNCHIIPNHALIILGLLYGGGDLLRSLTIVNTSGWDTDCNAGNLGCLLGIMNGLAPVEATPALRDPIADRLYLSTADGGRGITDAVIETYHVVNSGRGLAGLDPVEPKGGARFHFDLPGAVQGFQAEGGSVRLENVAGHSRLGQRSLALHYQFGAGAAGRVATPTFIPPDMIAETHYALMAAPTLYPGQTVRATLSADSANRTPVTCRLFYRAYAADDTLEISYGPGEIVLVPGAEGALTWALGRADSNTIMRVGIEVATTTAAVGSVYLDTLTWDGAPDVIFTRPPFPGTLWRRVWVNAMDHVDARWPEPFHLSQDEGRGLLMTGTADWSDYDVQSSITPHLATAWGIAARVQGLKRYYALLLRQGGTLQVIKMREGETVLAETPVAWTYDTAYELRLRVRGTHIHAWLNGELCLEAHDSALAHGGVALVCEEGRIVTDAVVVHPPHKV
jgi:ADP-ribosylglycohydrolase